MRRVVIVIVAMCLISWAHNSVQAADPIAPPFTQEKIGALNDIQLFVFGEYYAEGRGVARNLALADQLFEAAFERNAARATEIGNVYLDKLKQFAKASHWYERGAAAGAERAVDYIGFIYIQAKEHPLPDHAEFNRLLKSDDGFSAIRLGHMYLYGWDVERDPAEAEKWFQKALRKGHIRLLADLGDYTRDGRLGHDQVKLRALAWYLAATHFGIIRAPAAVLAISFDMPASETRAAEALSKKLIAELKTFDVKIYPFP